MSDDIGAIARLAADAYRGGARSAYHFARGKLGGDPVFAALLRDGAFVDGDRILDLGCGQGVLEVLLAVLESPGAQAVWPGQWPAAPRGLTMCGIDLRADAVALGNAALARLSMHQRFVLHCADIRKAGLGRYTVVTILDVLHYIPHADQRALLEHVVARLDPGGRVLLRVGDAARGLRFRFTLLNDWLITRMRGGAGRFWTRTAADWIALLESLGLEVQMCEMSEGTPFANVLLSARCRR